MKEDAWENMNNYGVFETLNIHLSETTREGKGKSIVAFPKTYCVVDTETTGLSPDWDNIIEIGAVKYADGVEVDRFESLVQPPVISYDGRYVDSFIESLTGITNEMLATAPVTEEVIRQFDAFLGDDIIIGYNVNFDINFLYECYVKYLGKPLANDYIDIMRFSRKLYPEMEHHRLVDMVARYGIDHERAHRAMSDVLATAECYNLMREEALKQYGDESSFIDAFKKWKKYYYDPKYSCRASNIEGDVTKNDPDSPLYQRYCVFTGTLEKFTRKQAMQIVADLGGINEDGVTKKTNFLILGNNDYCSTIKDGKSGKQKKAEKAKLSGQDIEIIPESVFYDMIGESL